MCIPSAAYKMSLLSVLHTLGANMPGAQELVGKFEQAVRDEEFALHERKEGCRWDGSDAPCPECPVDKTRYCP